MHLLVYIVKIEDGPIDNIYLNKKSAQRFNALVRPPFHVVDSDGGGHTVDS